MADLPSNDNKAFSSVPDFTDASSDIADRFFADVPKYKDADPALKAALDERIEKINYKSLDTITSLGKETSDALDKSSDAILRRTQTATSFLNGFSGIKEQLANFDFETVGKLAGEYTEKMKRQAAKAALSIAKNPGAYLAATAAGVFAGIPAAAVVLAGGLGFKKFAKRNKEPTIEDIRHEIDASMIQLGEVVSNLENSRDNIPGIIKDLDGLRDARTAAYSDFALDIAAGQEKLRRMKEEDIPALEKEAASSNSMLKANDLRDMTNAYTTLNMQVTNMATLHASCLVQLNTLADLKQALGYSQVKIDGHLNLSRGQWKALLAEAQTTANVAQIGETISEADKFGQKIMDQSQKLSDMTRSLIEESLTRGTLDPVKVIQYLEKGTKNINEGIQFVENLNRNLDKTRENLAKASKDMREAAQGVATAPSTAKVEQEQQQQAKIENKLELRK